MTWPAVSPAPAGPRNTDQQHRTEERTMGGTVRQLNCSIVKPDGTPLPRTTQTAAEVVIDLDQEGARYTALMDPALDGRLLIRFPDSSPPGVGANVRVWA